MERLTQLLEANGVTIAPTELAKILEKRELTEDLTDAQIMDLVNELTEQMGKPGLAKSTASGKVASRKAKAKKVDLKEEAQVTDYAIARLMQNATADTEAIVTGVEHTVDEAAVKSAKRMINAIEGLPVATMQHFSEMAAGSEDNASFLYERSRAIARSILSPLLADAAE